MNNRSARIEITTSTACGTIVNVRDYIGPGEPCMGSPRSVGGRWPYPKMTCGRYASILRLVNACGLVIETTDGYDLRIVAEWPPASVITPAMEAEWQRETKSA